MGANQIKIFKLLLLSSLLLLNLNSSGQNTSGFIILGKLKGLKNGTQLYLIRNTEKGTPDTVSKVMAKNEKFVFTGKVPLEAEAYFIKIDTIRTKYTFHINGYITLLLENSIVQIEGIINNLSLEHLKVKGLKAHKEFVEYKLAIKEASEKINKLYAEFQSIENKDSSQVSNFREKLKKAQQFYEETRNNWIKTHLNSLYTPWVILSSFNTVVQLDFYYQKLSNSAKRSKYGIALKKEIDALNSTEIGNIAPDLTLPTADGTYLSISEIITKGKLTLLDFWASWCHPCRIEFSNLKRLYEIFHRKGFNIVGISIDRTYDSWRKAIEQDKLPWHNILDKDKSAANIYSINEIPRTFLLDSTGKILAKDLKGEDLAKELEKILGTK